MFNKIKNILLNPHEFFGRLNEKSLKPAFFYFMVVFLIFSVLNVIMNLFFGNFTRSIIEKIMGLPAEVLAQNTAYSWIIANGVLGYALGLGLSFLSAAILLIWLMIWGVRPEYSKTYQLYVYGNTPNYIFGWIPVVNWFVWIWSMITLIIGTMKMYKTSKNKALWIYLLPVIIFFSLMIIGLSLLLYATQRIAPSFV